MRQLSRSPEGVLRQGLRAERRAYAVSLRRLVAHFAALGARPPTLSGKLRWTALGALAALGLAAPPLPVYARMPRDFAKL